MQIKISKFTVNVSEVGGVWMANAKSPDGQRASVAAASEKEALTRIRKIIDKAN